VAIGQAPSGGGNGESVRIFARLCFKTLVQQFEARTMDCRDSVIERSQLIGRSHVEFADRSVRSHRDGLEQGGILPREMLDAGGWIKCWPLCARDLVSRHGVGHSGR